MNASNLIHHRLQAFAEAVKAKTAILVLGQPEEQLRAPFESFVVGAATDLNWEVVCVGDASLPDRLGRPDYAVERDKLLAGYVELKAPGAGADADRFRGRDRDQFKRFSKIPNLRTKTDEHRHGAPDREALRQRSDALGQHAEGD